MADAVGRFPVRWDGSTLRDTPHEGPVPIVIGVTGHIDLDLRGDNESKLRKAVHEILSEIRGYAPDSPLVVLSGLAEGADRFVTRIAMADYGARHVAVLPMPAEEYERDFPGTAGEFRDLLGKSQCIVMDYEPGVSHDQIAVPGDARNAQYASAGAYIVRQSQVLIALWNGAMGGEGGTSDVLERALEGVRGPLLRACSPLDVYSVPPVYRVVTPRLKDAQLKGQAFSWEVLPATTPDGEIRRDRFRRVARRLNTFNVDCIAHAEVLKNEARVSAESLLPHTVSSALPDTVQRLGAIFGIADALSIRFRKNQRLALITLLVSSVTAVMCFELYSHNVIPEPLVFAIYPGALAIAFLIYNIARRRDVQNKYLDYRGLAEGLRVQAFWRVAGLKYEVADEYLIHHRSELDWIREAIRAWNLPVGGLAADPVEHPLRDPARLAILRKHWLDDQGKFFAARERRDERGEKAHHRFVWTLFLASVLFATAFAAGTFLLHGVRWFDEAHEYIVFTIGMLPVLAASLGAYSEVMAFSAQAQRYKWMAEVFARASEQFNRATESGDHSAIKAVVEDLGHIALEENGNWVMMHRDHPLEVHF